MKKKDTATAEPRLCTAFAGSRRIGSGDLREVAAKAKRVIARGGVAPVLVFDDVSGEVIDLDFREVSAPPRPEPELPRGPGRPKLGVIGREVTLLPRHWEWLNSQPGGASVALRKLVEEARRVNAAKDRVRERDRAIDQLAERQPILDGGPADRERHPGVRHDRA